MPVPDSQEVNETSRVITFRVADEQHRDLMSLLRCRQRRKGKGYSLNQLMVDAIEDYIVNNPQPKDDNAPV